MKSLSSRFDLLLFHVRRSTSSRSSFAANSREIADVASTVPSNNSSVRCHLSRKYVVAYDIIPRAFQQKILSHSCLDVEVVARSSRIITLARQQQLANISRFCSPPLSEATG